MLPEKPRGNQRLVPLSDELMQDILDHPDEYHLQPLGQPELDFVGDSREASRAAASSCTNLTPLELRRRTGGFAEGPIAVAPRNSVTFLYRPKPKSTNVPEARSEIRIVEKEKIEAEETTPVRDPIIESLLQRVRLSFVDSNLMIKQTPSRILARLQDSLDSLTDDICFLQTLIPLLFEQSGQLKFPGVETPQSTVSLYFKRVSAIRLTSSSDEVCSLVQDLHSGTSEMERNIERLSKICLGMRMNSMNEQKIPGRVTRKSPVKLRFKPSREFECLHPSYEVANSEQDPQSDSSEEERNIEKELYQRMQMNLVNMVAVPKSQTSVALNKRKDFNFCLGGCHCSWRHRYTDEDWRRDYEAAIFLRSSENVRRQ
ncbi:uncharacterized protein LOC108098453 [Drosophila ficusphila]|uniref:uncharacterized protein LOC108098453 n=1 Tax=Drosophila ficusphila TaxID=30025 RepID=UPI0007E6C0BF|nr:uncharacterized protein LOC108098453 [Drosophila ficusphila]